MSVNYHRIRMKPSSLSSYLVGVVNFLLARSDGLHGNLATALIPEITGRRKLGEKPVLEHHIEEISNCKRDELGRRE